MLVGRSKPPDKAGKETSYVRVFTYVTWDEHTYFLWKVADQRRICLLYVWIKGAGNWNDRCDAMRHSADKTWSLSRKILDVIKSGANIGEDFFISLIRLFFPIKSIRISILGSLFRWESNFFSFLANVIRVANFYHSVLFTLVDWVKVNWVDVGHFCRPAQKWKGPLIFYGHLRRALPELRPFLFRVSFSSFTKNDRKIEAKNRCVRHCCRSFVRLHFFGLLDSKKGEENKKRDLGQRRKKCFFPRRLFKIEERFSCCGLEAFPFTARKKPPHSHTVELHKEKERKSFCPRSSLKGVLFSASSLRKTAHVPFAFESRHISGVAKKHVFISLDPPRPLWWSMKRRVAKGEEDSFFPFSAGGERDMKNLLRQNLECVGCSSRRDWRKRKRGTHFSSSHTRITKMTTTFFLWKLIHVP